MTTTNNKPDPVTSENRELMDFLCEHQEQMCSEVYVKLSELVAKKEEANPKPKQKYYVIHYHLTEIISFAKHSYLECCDEHKQDLTTMFNYKTPKRIIRGVKKPTGSSNLDDILSGVVQLRRCGHPYVKEGDTVIKSCPLANQGSDWDDAMAGNKTTTIHVLSMEEYELEVDEED